MTLIHAYILGLAVGFFCGFFTGYVILFVVLKRKEQAGPPIKPPQLGKPPRLGRCPECGWLTDWFQVIRSSWAHSEPTPCPRCGRTSLHKFTPAGSTLEKDDDR